MSDYSRASCIEYVRSEGNTSKTVDLLRVVTEIRGKLTSL